MLGTVYMNSESPSTPPSHTTQPPGTWDAGPDTLPPCLFRSRNASPCVFSKISSLGLPCKIYEASLPLPTKEAVAVEPHVAQASPGCCLVRLHVNIGALPLQGAAFPISRSKQCTRNRYEFGIPGNYCDTESPYIITQERNRRDFWCESVTAVLYMYSLQHYFEVHDDRRQRGGLGASGAARSQLRCKVDAIAV